MKKMILFLLVCLLYFSSFSQTLTFKDTLIYETGNELFKFHRQTSTGNSLVLIGGALLVIGTSKGSSRSGSGLMQVIGGGMAIVGTLMTLSASRHVGNAGAFFMLVSGKPIAIKHRKKEAKKKLP